MTSTCPHCGKAYPRLVQRLTRGHDYRNRALVTRCCRAPVAAGVRVVARRKAEHHADRV